MLRAAIASDGAAVREVVHAAYRGYIPRIGKPPGPMLDDYEQRIAAGQTWVLEDAGQIVGMLVLEQSESGFLLDNIAVLPEHHGKGFGATLIRFAEAEALRRGFAAIDLYTHALMTENIDLYRRIGFVETHRISEKGYDRIYMSKRLR